MNQQKNSEYVFDQTQHLKELARLQAIEKIFDPGTQRRLLGTGLKPGWRCLEIGPGAGSIMKWLDETVENTGKVVAVDVNPRFIKDKQSPQIEIIKADIRLLETLGAAFDLIHARYVLIHIPDYQQTLKRILSFLKPGGWIVIEEPDFSAARPIFGNKDDFHSIQNINQAIEQMFRDMGMNHAVGLKLPTLFDADSIKTIENETPLSRGTSEIAMMMKMSTEQLKDKYLKTGKASLSDIEGYCRFAEDPQSWGIYYATVAVVAQK